MTRDEVSDVNNELELTFSNNTFLHSCGFSSHCASEMKNMDKELAKRDRGIGFNVIIIDTGANRSSLGLSQYLSYCQEHNAPALLEKKWKRVGELGGGSVRTIGTSVFSVPFPDIGVTCNVQFHITKDEKCPSVLCLRDLTRTGLDIIVQNDWLHFMGKTQKLVREHDFLCHRRKPDHALFSYA